jgi:predicted RNA-binding protein with RPS1 domain
MHVGQATTIDPDVEDARPRLVGQKVTAKVIDYRAMDERWTVSEKAVGIEAAIHAKFPPGEVIQSKVVRIRRTEIVVQFEGFIGYISPHIGLMLMRHNKVVLGAPLEIRLAGWGRRASGPCVIPNTLYALGTITGHNHVLSRKGKKLTTNATVSTPWHGPFSLNISEYLNPEKRLPVGTKVLLSLVTTVKRDQFNLKAMLMPFGPPVLADRIRNNEIIVTRVDRVIEYGAFCLVADGQRGLIHWASQPHPEAVAAARALKLGDTVQVEVLDQEPELGRYSLRLL